MTSTSNILARPLANMWSIGEVSQLKAELGQVPDRIQGPSARPNPLTTQAEIIEGTRVERFLEEHIFPKLPPNGPESLERALIAHLGI